MDDLKRFGTFLCSEDMPNRYVAAKLSAIVAILLIIWVGATMALQLLEYRDRVNERESLNEQLKRERDRNEERHEMSMGAFHFAASMTAIDGARAYAKDIDSKIYATEYSDIGLPEEYVQSKAALLIAIREHTMKFTAAYLGLDINTMGANFMFYISDQVLTKSAKGLLGGSDIFFHSDLSKHQLGGLYMPLQLHQPCSGNPGRMSLYLPIFREETLLDDGNVTREHPTATLPGSPKALFSGFSYVGNTQNEDSYPGVPLDTRDSLIHFFKTRANNTGSLISFRIPYRNDEKDQDGLHGLGVLNIESSDRSRLTYTASWHQVLYSHIYPSLLRLSPFLKNYRHALIGHLRQVGSSLYDEGPT